MGVVKPCPWSLSALQWSRKRQVIFWDQMLWFPNFRNERIASAEDFNGFLRTDVFRHTTHADYLGLSQLCLRQCLVGWSQLHPGDFCSHKWSAREIESVWTLDGLSRCTVLGIGLGLLAVDCTKLRGYVSRARLWMPGKPQQLLVGTGGKRPHSLWIYGLQR